MKKKSIVISLLILTSMTSFAKITTDIVEETALAIKLEKNKKAPFSGVLVPEFDYKMMTADIDMKYQYESEVMDLRLNIDKLEKQKTRDEVVWFLSGAALSAILVNAFGSK